MEIDILDFQWDMLVEAKYEYESMLDILEYLLKQDDIIQKDILNEIQEKTQKNKINLDVIIDTLAEYMCPEEMYNVNYKASIDYHRKKIIYKKIDE